MNNSIRPSDIIQKMLEDSIEILEDAEVEATRTYASIFDMAQPQTQIPVQPQTRIQVQEQEDDHERWREDAGIEDEFHPGHPSNYG